MTFRARASGRGLVGPVPKELGGDFQAQAMLAREIGDQARLISAACDRDAVHGEISICHRFEKIPEMRDSSGAVSFTNLNQTVRA